MFRGGNKNDSTPPCPEITGLTLKQELVREVDECAKQMHLIGSYLSDLKMDFICKLKSVTVNTSRAVLVIPVLPVLGRQLIGSYLSDPK